MNNLDIETFKNTWKKESSHLFEKEQLSDDAIKEYLSKRSKDISNLYSKGILIDILFKICIGISFIVLMLLFSGNMTIQLISILSIILLGTLIFFQLRINKKFKTISEIKDDIKTELNNKIGYYYKYYIKSIFISSVSGPYFFICGSLYYFYFKYGFIRHFETDDYFVFGLGVIIAYILTLASNKYQFNFYIKQLKENVKHLDKDSLSRTILKKQAHKRRRILLIFAISIILGALIFSYIIFAS